MPTTESIENVVNRERINIHRVVKGSKLGKHITKNILEPILEDLNVILDDIIDWCGFLLQDEIHYLLSTASPGHTYDIYYVDPDAPYGFRTMKIGEYQASAKGGPPKSPKGGGGEMPQSGSLYQSIVYSIEGNTITLGIKSITPPYKLWYKWGKLFHFADSDLAPGDTSVYGIALDNPSMIDSKGEEQEERSWPYRPYWRSGINKVKPQLKNRFREEFSKALQQITRRPTVKRALQIRFLWESK